MFSRWSTAVDAKLAEGKQVDSVLELVTKTLALLSDSVLQDQPPLRRKKIENMVNIIIQLIDSNVYFRSLNLYTNVT